MVLNCDGGGVREGIDPYMYLGLNVLSISSIYSVHVISHQTQRRVILLAKHLG